MSFVDLVNEFMAGRSLEGFARDLNTCITDPAEYYSRGAVFTWVHGTYKPRYSMLEHIANHAPSGSWMFDFANKGMLAVMGDRATDNGAAQPRA